MPEESKTPAEEESKTAAATSDSDNASSSAAQQVSQIFTRDVGANDVFSSLLIDNRLIATTKPWSRTLSLWVKMKSKR